MPLLRRARNDTVVHFRADGTARSYVKVIGAVSPSVESVAIEELDQVTIVALVVASSYEDCSVPLVAQSQSHQATTPVTFADGYGHSAAPDTVPERVALKHSLASATVR